MITLRDFTIGFGDRTLVANANATFGRGTLTALLGRNGSGKSTMLRAIAGLNSHFSGEILLDGEPQSSLSPARLARTLAFVTTGRTRIAAMRSRDVVAMGRAPYTNWLGRLSEADNQAIERALDDVGMAAYASRTLDSMSDGECQRIMIARALAQDTPIMLLDEPTSFLDLPNRYELCRLLASLAHERGKCILFSTHELDIARDTADTLAVIDPPMLHAAPTSRIIASGLLNRLFAIS